jgi:hypothetical protein
MTDKRVAGLVVVALVGVAGCGSGSPAPSAPTSSPASTTRPATTSVTPVPATSTGPPRPLPEQDPCGLLSDQDEHNLKFGPGRPTTSVEGRACAYDISAGSGVTVTIVDNGGVSAAGAGRDVSFVEPPEQLGRHQAGVTFRSPATAVYVVSIAVGAKARVDVTSVAPAALTTTASVTAHSVARVIEPKLP